MTNMIDADDEGVARAADVLRRGGLVAFPTETVYGLGADAGDDRAVAAIFAAKGRPKFNPLIVHVQDIAQAEQLVEFAPPARKLAEAFWPGPLSVVLPRRANAAVSLLASAGLDTIAVRAPSHPVARALLAKSGLAIAAPSANPSESLSPTRAAHVALEMGDKVDLILDGGPNPMGLESTVVGFEDERPVLLRPGVLARARIEDLVGPLGATSEAKVRSPGQLRRHYAPRTRLRLDAQDVKDDEALLAFGGRPPAGARQTRNLSPSGNLEEAAGNFFAMLRELDAARCARIAVMPIPDHGLGEAINDRLRRAAAETSRDD